MSSVKLCFYCMCILFWGKREEKTCCVLLCTALESYKVLRGPQGTPLSCIFNFFFFFSALINTVEDHQVFADSSCLLYAAYCCIFFKENDQTRRVYWRLIFIILWLFWILEILVVYC